MKSLLSCLSLSLSILVGTHFAKAGNNPEYHTAANPAHALKARIAAMGDLNDSSCWQTSTDEAGSFEDFLNSLPKELQTHSHFAEGSSAPHQTDVGHDPHPSNQSGEGSSSKDYKEWFDRVVSEDKPLIKDPEDSYLLAAGLGRLAVHGGVGIAKGLGKAICFPGQTPICANDIGSQTIDRIQVGDLIYSCDREQGKTACEYRLVREVFTNTTDHLIRLCFNKAELKTTAHHPFYVLNLKRWVDAQDLKMGDQLQDLSGESVVLEAVDYEVGEFTVYNLEIDRNHTYYAAGVLVHNCNSKILHNEIGSIGKDVGKSVAKNVETGAASSAIKHETKIIQGDKMAPEVSHPNSIYEAINPNGTVRSRTFYDQNGRSFNRQDFDHPHHGQKPHEHSLGFNAEGLSIEKEVVKGLKKGYTNRPTN